MRFNSMSVTGLDWAVTRARVRQNKKAMQGLVMLILTEGAKILDKFDMQQE